MRAPSAKSCLWLPCLLLSGLLLAGETEQNDAPSVANLQADALALWEQSSRLARFGIWMPKEFPGVAALITGLKSSPSAERRRALARVLDGYAEEFRRKELQTSPFGQLQAFSSEPLVAGSVISLRQTYRVEARLAPGSGLLLATHWTHAVSLQTREPGALNHVSMEGAPDGVRFAPGFERRGGIHGGYNRAKRQVYFELRAGELLQGDEITLVYRQLSLPKTATDTFSMPVYVRLTEGGHLFSLRPPVFSVTGDAPRQVLARMPSILKRDEPFTLKLTALDAFGNLSPGRVPDLEIVHDGDFFSRVLSFQGELDVSLLSFPKTGDVRLELRSGGGNIWGETNPSRVSDDPLYRIVWADLQQRTALSDGQGTPDSHIHLAERDGLGILGMAEKDTWLNAADWQALLNAGPAPELLLLPGLTFARSARAGGEHTSLLTSRRWDIRLEDLGRQKYPGPGAWLAAILHGGAGGDWYHLALPQPAATDLRSMLAPALSGAQIFGADGGSPWLADALAERGYEVAALGTAGRLRGPSSLSKGASAFWQTLGETPLEALRSGRSYATSGARILLNLRINGRLPETRLPQSSVRRFEGRVLGEQPVTSIVLWKNGQLHEQIDYAYPDPEPLGDSFALPPGVQSAGETRRAEAREVRAGLLEVGWFSGRPARPRELLLDLAGGSFAEPLGGGLKPVQTSSGLVFELAGRGRLMRTHLPVTGLDEDALLLLDLAGMSLRIPMAEAWQQTVTRTLTLAGETHRFTFRLGPEELREALQTLPRSRSFQFLDQTDGKTEDIYALEVRQLDDEVARTLGIRIGGYTVD